MRLGNEWRVEEVPTSITNVVQELCGIFPNPFLGVPFKGGPLVVEEGKLLFLVASHGFNNQGSRFKEP